MSVSQLERVLAAHRRELVAQDVEWQRRIGRLYFDALKSVQQEQASFARFVERQIAAGAPESPSWLMREQRYLSLQSRFYRATQQFGIDSWAMLDPIARTALKTSLPQLAAELQAQMGVTYPGYGPETWAAVNTRAIEAGMALVSREASPLRQLLERDLPETAVATFRSEWVRGLVLGHNPRKIAARISNNVDTLSLGRSQLIARTEFHRAYRAGKVEQYAGLTTVTGWRWRSALDAGTCSICIGMHGTFHPKDEMLDGHPNCRCTMIPITSDPYGLGTGAQLDDGEAWFARQPADRQLRTLGPSRFKMYQEGTPLQSMIGQRQSPIWGSMRVLEPLGRVRPSVPVRSAADPVERYRAEVEAAKQRWVTPGEDYAIRKAANDLVNGQPASGQAARDAEVLLNTLERAPILNQTIYRGEQLTNIPEVGSVIRRPLSAWGNQATAEGYAESPAGAAVFGAASPGRQVVLQMRGARAVPVPDLGEYLSGGQLRVVASRYDRSSRITYLTVEQVKVMPAKKKRT